MEYVYAGVTFLIVAGKHYVGVSCRNCKAARTVCRPAMVEPFIVGHAAFENAMSDALDAAALTIGQ